ncbi:MAG: hypothetical protein ABR915_13470 [Thermoguttaceae bacterium]|jgi:CRP-like cAMP-binding protein
MSTTTSTTELEEAVRFALTHKADPVVLKHTREEAVRIREELRRENGVMNIAAELVREIRDE